jgi:hypothetical protein
MTARLEREISAPDIQMTRKCIIAYQNKAVVYGILFRAETETLSTIAADPKHRLADRHTIHTACPRLMIQGLRLQQAR